MRRAVAAALALVACSANYGAADALGARAAAGSGMAMDPSAAMAEISAQVDSALTDGTGMAPPPHHDPETAPAGVEMPPTGSAFLPEAMRFHASQQEVVSALNSLDIKSGAKEPAKAPEPKKHRAIVVEAFGHIALETMHRATGAVHWLRQRSYALAQHIKADAHNYKAWMEGHKRSASGQITAEVERVGALTDEVAHLRLVLQDAVTKDRSYQVQLNELTSERQLQRTPPVMPAVVAAGMSDEQFNAVVGKLHAARAKARQVIAQTTEGIKKREQLIERGTTWAQDSKLVLQKWYAHQVSVYNKLVLDGKKAVAEAARRVEAVERIQADAKKFHQDYVHALQRLHLEERVAALKKSRAHHDAMKVTDEYEKVRVKSFVAALDVEIEGLKAKIAKIPGDGKVVPPPAVWGVLAQFHSFAVHAPHFSVPHYSSVVGAAPYLHAAAGQWAQASAGPASQGQVDPSISNYVPTMAESSPLDDPSTALGTSHYNPFPAATGAGGAAPEASSQASSGEQVPSGAALLEEMGGMFRRQFGGAEQGPAAQAQQELPVQMPPRAQQPARAGGVPAPPVMPQFPEPPRADFLM